MLCTNIVSKIYYIHGIFLVLQTQIIGVLEVALWVMWTSIKTNEASGLSLSTFKGNTLI